jgi:outer membrane protein assembly factor BamB
MSNLINVPKYFITLILLLSVIFIFSSAVFAAHSTEQKNKDIISTSKNSNGLANTAWPKFQHDNKNTGQSDYTGPTSPELKWKFQTGGSIASSPAIGSDGTIYIGSSDKNLYALDTSGNLKWKFPTGDIIGSSPAIGSDGTIYFGSYDHYLYALYPKGTLKWKLSTGDKIDSSPAIGKNGTIFIGSGAKYLYAIDPSGTQKWTFKADFNSGLLSSPAIDQDTLDRDNVIYIFGATKQWNPYTKQSQGYYKLYAIDPNGKEKWNYYQFDRFWFQLSEKCCPTIASDGTIYISVTKGNTRFSIKNYFVAIRPNGTAKWEYESSGRYSSSSSPAIDKSGNIYFPGEDNYKLYAFTSSGKVKWEYQFNSYIGYPVTDAGSNIYIGCNDGYLYALDSFGRLQWKYKTGDHIISSPAIGSDGTLYLGSFDHYLYALQQDITPPTASATPTGGTYKNTKTVTLSMSEAGSIYYTINGAKPTTNSAKYFSPLIMSEDSVLKFLAVDLAQNKSPIYSETYTFKQTRPSENSSNINAKTIPMQKTGLPLTGIIISTLILLGGIILPRRIK